MKIAVCVKQVPDATVHKRIDPQTKRLDRSGEATLNPTDLNAIEEALRVKEAQGGEVVLVSFGPERAVESLRKGLAMGADRAVLVADEAAAGSDLLGTSRALAAALEREEADLVVFGQASNDGDGAVLWAAVADRLRRPLISQVATLTVEPGSVGDLGLEEGRSGEAGAKTTVLELGPPPSRGDTITIEDDGSAAQKILDYVVERRLV